MEPSRIWVEAWSPEYGSSFEAAGGLEQSEEQVAPYIETDDWAAVHPPPCPWPPAAFVDGVGRVEARAFLATGPQIALGICASVAAGSVQVPADRGGSAELSGRAAFGPAAVSRMAIFGGGSKEAFPPVSSDLSYISRSVPGPGPEHLIQDLQTVRADLELEAARGLAGKGLVVIADGPLLARRESHDIIGLVKSHQKSYLPPPLESFVAALRAGQRTPLFQFGAIRPRYSWYLRLAEPHNQHPWAAVARCEVSSSLPLERAIQLADVTARHLPRFASKAFWDTRAPQNLVPIASLERRLWHLLGDRELIYRRIRSALNRRWEGQVA